jgi:triacylglycerol lipase
VSGQNANTPKRIHVVLIPGFAGFDALGQLEYYAGITPIFRDFSRGLHVLHYFDNFPTAAVVTRAARLLKYLAKRIARGSIAKHDEIVLIGHSTGGLDIRRLLCPQKDEHPIIVDGEIKVDAEEIRQRVRRVVFLSVPHWGTNIADFVQRQRLWRKALIDELRAAVAGSQYPFVEPIESLIAGSTAAVTGAGVFRAVQDALDEADEHLGKTGPERTADAQEAASELALYLRHMASDFHAIDDLTSRPPRFDEPKSPAHFDEKDRERERSRLKKVEFQSYVTIGRRLFHLEPDKPAPPLELTNPWTYPSIWDGGSLSRNSDIIYRLCYRACAGGPFDPPDSLKEKGKRLRPRDPIQIWDNDGIVNTLSMLWPDGENVLVPADHMDIVGHYENVRDDPGGGRRFRAYDLLKSRSGFDKKTFNNLWHEIFTFCLQSKAGKKVRGAAAGLAA